MTAKWVFFTWWRDLNARWALWSRRRQFGVLGTAAIVGLIARLWAQTFPYNYDFTAYVAVSDQILSGGNPYETGKHNYGPIWFLLHSTVRRFLEEPEAFRVGLTVIFSIADIIIAYLLMRRRYLPAACLFLLAPVTIAISGQHGQFDNLAITLALGSAIFLVRDVEGSRLYWRDWISVLLLGISLSTKHDFLVLCLWFAFMQRSLLRRIFYAVVPPVIFGLTLLPYWLMNPDPIREFVLQYRSNPNAPAYYTLFPDELVWGWVNRGYIVFIFLAILVVLGWWYRRMPAFEATLVYAVSLVVFSTAIVDQYFAIPMAGVSVFLNIGFLLWMVYISVYLLGEPEDFNLPFFDTVKLHVAPYQEGTYRDQFVFLFVGWLIMNVWLWRQGWIIGKITRSESVNERAKQPSGTRPT